MKKFILAMLSVFMITATLCAEEKILFDSSAKSDLDGYDYISNFEMTSDSGHFRKDSFKILEPNDKGIRFIAFDVPSNLSTSYKVLTAYPSFLNEKDEGIGTGFIYNVKYIKSVKVEATTNRPYDEIILMYRTSPTGPVKEILMPQDFNAIHSMEPFELVFDNPSYIEDPNKREPTASPVLGSSADGLYLVGFRIKTNAPSGYNEYSPYSVLYINKVTVVYDKMFTDEQVENNRVLREEFGIKPNTEAEVKAKAHIAERNRLRTVEASLMDKPEDTADKPTTIEEAK